MLLSRSLCNWAKKKALKGPLDSFKQPFCKTWILCLLRRQGLQGANYLVEEKIVVIGDQKQVTTICRRKSCQLNTSIVKAFE